MSAAETFYKGPMPPEWPEAWERMTDKVKKLHSGRTPLDPFVLLPAPEGWAACCAAPEGKRTWFKLVGTNLCAALRADLAAKV